jgi:uncharacterized protein (DUF1800 family)
MPLKRQEVEWLGKIANGINSDTVAAYRQAGRDRFLEAQLSPGEAELPAQVTAQLAALRPADQDAAAAIDRIEAARRAIRESKADMAAPDAQAARRDLDRDGNEAVSRAVQTELLRSLYSPQQLREQMVWFWLNHFSVFQGKADVRWLAADYLEHAIRPHVFGRFEDLVRATLEHPAMLQFLDNAQNTAGHLNENYARELLELHTLGVGGGYSQRDVENLARILTGAGIHRAARNQAREPEGMVRSGAFEFDPKRHDFGPKVLLGQTIKSRGFNEIDEALDLITRQPACAHFISRELAVYFVDDNPPPALIERMAGTFQATHGDIAAVLRTLFTAPELAQGYGAKFKDPWRFVISAVRLAYDGRPIGDAHPIEGWVRTLGEVPFGRQTPDGYSLVSAGWASSGQMARRFDIARAIGAGAPGLFPGATGAPAATPGGFPQLASRLYFEAVEPSLTPTTRSTIAGATSQAEWNLLLLASPEFGSE